MVSYKI